PERADEEIDRWVVVVDDDGDQVQVHGTSLGNLFEDGLSVQISLTTLAGLPTATTLAGRSLATTAPAPTTVFSPMVTPGHTMTPPPSQTLSPMVMGSAASHLARRVSGST